MPPREFPRQFVAADATLDDWPQIELVFDQLDARPVDTAEQLHQWLLDCSELTACIHEVGTEREVRMTCQTDDEQRKQAYLDFVENIAPRCKPRWHALNEKYTASPAAGQLPAARFQVFDRSVRNSVELFRPQNVPLQTEEAKLTQRFQEISGAMTVRYDGQEQTLQQLSRYQELPRRSVRQETWEMSTARRLQDASALEDLFDELYRLRQQMALNADLPNYRGYAFKAKERFDYTPQDCLDFHDAIEQTVVPLMRDLQKRRVRKLGVGMLRPWDLAVDEEGRPPLRPFTEVEELCDKAGTVFNRIDVALADQFDAMRRSGLLDLESRKGKAPGGYMATFEERRQPFIFMNAVGLQRDVRTLFHECGHAFHTYAARNDPLLDYRSAPLEFAEVASMSMELLAYEHFDVLYQGEDLVRAKRAQLEGTVEVFPWIATIDAFQHWLYTDPDHTRDQRREHWLGLRRRFGGIEDFSGHEDALAYFWQRQLHLFQVPFYYVEYGIAQLGALQVWRRSRDGKPQALRAYRNALSLGGSRPLPQLFEAADIRFDFTVDTLGPLMAALRNELDALGE
ncbi:MAG: M3 family oligoendopeptidase [Planctomycetota bacterium]